MATAPAEKSTNVRNQMSTLRGVVSVADRLSPRVAARVALKTFLTPPRAARPDAEVALLAVGEPLTVLVDRKAIATWTWGEGPAVQLVHGWGGRGSQFGALVPALVNAGFRVVAHDAPAHGDTPGQVTTLGEMARIARAVADVAGGVEAVVAHSFGAAATTVALAHGLAARRAVYVAPVYRIRAAVDRFADAAGLSPRAAGLFVEGLTAAAHASPDALDGVALAPRQTAALTVVHDVGDREVAFTEGEGLAAAWPGARLVETSGLGHRRILAAPDVVELIRDVVLGRTVAPARLDEAARIDRDLLDRDGRRARALAR